MTLNDRVAVITGGARGIGRGICLELARRGCAIAFNYLHSSVQAEELRQELISLGVRAHAYRVDVADHEAAKAMIKQVRDEFGRIDYLVNNAGITRDNLILRISEKDWDDVINTNLKGAFNFSKAAIIHMLRARSGSILNVTSISGVAGMAGQTNYSASKAGLIGFTKSLSRECASRGVTVNALALGLIETEMTETLAAEHQEKLLAAIPLGRYGSVEEVARIAAFLLSEDARYITGQVIQVDGGLAT